MIKLAYQMGAKLQITNNQNLTPLTLAAHLAKKEVNLTCFVTNKFLEKRKIVSAIYSFLYILKMNIFLKHCQISDID